MFGPDRRTAGMESNMNRTADSEAQSISSAAVNASYSNAVACTALMTQAD